MDIVGNNESGLPKAKLDGRKKGAARKGKKMFTVFGTNLEKGHGNALHEQSLICVCPEQDDGNRMAVRK